MSSSGFLPVPRDALAALPLDRVGEWLDLVSRAAWEDGKRLRNGIVLQKGELLVSLNRLAEDWDCSRRKVELALQRYEKMGWLERRPPRKGRDSRGTVYRVVEYDTYTAAYYGERDSKETQTKNKKKKAPPTTTHTPEQWAEIKQAYPRCRRANWRVAEERYGKLVKPHGHDFLLRQVRAYAAYCDERDDIQYVKAPEFYFGRDKTYLTEFASDRRPRVQTTLKGLMTPEVER